MVCTHVLTLPLVARPRPGPIFQETSPQICVLLCVCSFSHISWDGSSTTATPNTCPVNSQSGFTGPSPAPCTTWPPWIHTRTSPSWRSWSTAVTSRWVPLARAHPQPWWRSERSCLLSEPPRDAPEGPAGPAAGVKVEDVCRSYVLFELPLLPGVSHCLHVCSLQQEGGTGKLAVQLTVDNTPVVYSPVFFYFLPQWTYTIEHTLSGYLYISGQLLTALANCYFFIVGVHHFHLFKIRALMSHKSSMIYPKKWIWICRL